MLNKDSDKAFEAFWHTDDDDPVELHQMRDNVKKKDAKLIWDAAFKAGGHRPWYTLTAEQWQTLNDMHGGNR